MRTVVMVDDEVEILAYAKILWESITGDSLSDVEFNTYENPLDVLQLEKIDVLITDIKMPQMNGHDLISKMRAKFPTLPIIISSGHISSTDEFSFIEIESATSVITESVAKPNLKTAIVLAASILNSRFKEKLREDL